jgi:hypothetical protein
MNTPESRDPAAPPPRSYRLAMKVEAPVANALGISCRSYSRLAVARLDRPLTFGEQVRYRIHGLLCSLCRNYSKQLRVVGELSREFEDTQPPDSEAVERIKEKVRRELGQ